MTDFDITTKSKRIRKKNFEDIEKDFIAMCYRNHQNVLEYLKVSQSVQMKLAGDSLTGIDC